MHPAAANTADPQFCDLDKDNLHELVGHPKRLLVGGPKIATAKREGRSESDL